MLEKIKKLKVNIGWKSLILIGVCGILVLVDLLTKIFEEKDKWSFTVIPNFIEVQYSYPGGGRNPGAAFSFLANASWGQPFLIAITFIMLAVLIAVFTVLPERFIVLKVAISMIVAGAIGNLIDRLAFGEVRDFVSMNMLFTTAVCNFADFWIVIGTIVAIIDILFLNELALVPLTKKAKAAQAKAKEEQTSETGENTQAADETQQDKDGETQSGTDEENE